MDTSCFHTFLILFYIALLFSPVSKEWTANFQPFMTNCLLVLSPMLVHVANIVRDLQFLYSVLYRNGTRYFMEFPLYI